MDLKTFNPGDKVSLTTKDRVWEGNILHSYDPRVVLLKLSSGYNVGLRESEVTNAKLLEKSKPISRVDRKVDPKKGLRNVAVIITGGTISSRLDPKSGGVISTGVEDILEIAPKLREVCNVVSVDSPFMKLSEDMDPSDWKKIASSCAEAVNNPEVDGVILTHGTDTLSYTASALAFFLRDLGKPVALTYSQRSIDRGSTDAALNLVCAARFAVSDIAEVAIVGHGSGNDDFCFAMPATKTRKMHTSRRDAFKVVNAKPLARISFGTFDILGDFNARNNDLKVKVDSKFSESVALVKVYPGMSSDILNFYVKEDYKAIILEGTGMGHIPGRDSKDNWIPKVKKIIDKGILVCMTPQTIFGRLQPFVYASGRSLHDAGVVFLEDMLSETAFVKLGWILGHKQWSNSVKEKLLENISREFSKRLEE